MIVRILACLITLVTAGPASLWAGTDAFTEDFSTSLYRDGAQTTADWNGDLKLFDFTMSLLSTYTGLVRADDIYVDGDYAYVAASQEGLFILDISDKWEMTYVGSAPLFGAALGIDVAGDYAYVANGDHSFVVVDVSDRTNPVMTGEVSMGGSAWDVDHEGDYAYIAECVNAGNSSIMVIDVRDPANPAFVSEAEFPGEAWAIAVRGNLAFIVGGDEDLQIYDISEATVPVKIGAITVPEEPVEFDVSDTYVCFGGGKFRVIDVTDPTTPTIVSTFANFGLGNEVSVAGNFAYVGNHAFPIEVIDLSNPSLPVKIDNISPLGTARNIEIAGELAFVADGNAGVSVFQIANTIDTPVIAGKTTTPGDGLGVALNGSYAYFADGSAGITSIDISNPCTPITLGNNVSTDMAVDIVVDGPVAFVAERYGGLRTVDISNPAAPSTLGNFPIVAPNWIQGVAVQGDYCYVAAGQFGLFVMDVSDLTSIALVGGHFTPGGSARGRIAIDGNLAFVPSSQCCLEILDVSDPTNPALIGSYPVSGFTEGVTVSGGFAYLERSIDGLDIIDISDPTMPTLAAHYATATAVTGVAVAGNRLFMAEGQDGIGVLDITDPRFPSLVGRFHTRGVANDVAVEGNNAFVADGIDGGISTLQVLNRYDDLIRNVGVSLEIDNANEDILSARVLPVETNGVTWELSADGGSNWQAFEADGFYHQFSVAGSDLRWRATLTYSDKGVVPTVEEVTIQWISGSPTGIGDTPNVVGLDQNYPNPFNPTTRIPFAVPESAPVRLRVYDASGAHVVTLIDGVVAPGFKVAEWDGRNKQGDLVSSGVYLYRLEVGESVLTRKMTLLK